MTNLRPLSITLAACLALAACGGDASPDSAGDRAAPNATSAQAANAPYELVLESAENSRFMFCELSGTFTNNSDEPLSGMYVTFGPVFTSAALADLGKTADTVPSYYEAKMMYGRKAMTNRDADDPFVQPGETVTITGEANFGCETLDALSLRYFNCEGVKADGTWVGKRCGAPTLIVDNQTDMEIRR